ncbi:MAG: DUF3833 domain-containing protein [Burkholderiales bacterium]
MNRRGFLAAGIVATLGGCSAPDIDAFRSERPVLDLRRYFDGIVDAWGIVRDRDGMISQRFTVEIRATWQGDVGTLDESFRYSDGRTQRRVWTIRKQADRYRGTAADVVGEATGEAAGNAIRFRYTLDYPYGGTTVPLAVDDWMFLVDETVLLNRSSIAKFGVEVAQVFISFRRRGGP